MVLKKGKNGVNTSNTIRNGTGGIHGGIKAFYKCDMIQPGLDGTIMKNNSNGQIDYYSPNKSKNWEIIEAAPKRMPKQSREERMDQSSKEKKHEFQVHLKVRGKHKEPPKPNPSKKVVDPGEVNETDLIVPNGISEPKVVIKNNYHSRKNGKIESGWDKSMNEGDILVELPTTRSDKFIHQDTRRYIDSYDDPNQSKIASKKDIRLDFNPVKLHRK